MIPSSYHQRKNDKINVMKDDTKLIPIDHKLKKTLSAGGNNSRLLTVELGQIHTILIMVTRTMLKTGKIIVLMSMHRTVRGGITKHGHSILRAFGRNGKDLYII